MPTLTSKRKFTNLALDSVGIDTKGKQPNVSEQIQLVYNLDNISEQLFAHGSIGDFSIARPGIHHALQGECRNRRGMFIQEVIGAVAGPTAAVLVVQSVKIGTKAEFTPMTFEVDEPIGIQEGRPIQAKWTSGYITPAQHLTTLGFYSVDLGEPIANLMNGLFVGFGRFIIISSFGTDLAGNWSVRWKELSD